MAHTSTGVRLLVLGDVHPLLGPVEPCVGTTWQMCTSHVDGLVAVTRRAMFHVLGWLAVVRPTTAHSLAAEALTSDSVRQVPVLLALTS